MDDDIVLDYYDIFHNCFYSANFIYTSMKIQTNFSQYPELRIDEQQVKNCIRKHFGAIKAPIYLSLIHI